MEVLKYNENGLPLYWIDLDKTSIWYRKLVKRLDKNTSAIVHLSNAPKYIKNAYIKFIDNNPK